jgi:hypothetical protein
MTSKKQPTVNGGLNKGDTRPRTAGGKLLSNKLPARTSSSAPNKVKKITVCQARDALALVQVTAALAIPANLDEETKEAVLDGAHALYRDFQIADSIDSVLATLICVLNSTTMDAAARAKRSPTLEQREMELKSVIKGARTVIELTEAYDRRRARKQTVSVGQVKVEAGGQAVVGNVTSGPSVGNVTSAPNEAPPAQEMLPPPKNEDPTPSS